METLGSLLESAADSGGYISEVEDGEEVYRLEYSELLLCARMAASELIRLGALPGDRVIVATRSATDLAVAFFGASMAGAIPVVMPPQGVGIPRRSTRRMSHAVSDCRPTVVISDTVPPAATAVPGWHHVPTFPREFSSTAHVTRPLPSIELDQPAFIQYTSGSTGTARGVVLSHRNVHAQLARLSSRLQDRPDDIAVHWVPLSHDMGLVCGLLRPIFSGYPSLLMQAQDFIARPSAWVRLISESGASVTSAPPFGYALAGGRSTDLHTDPVDLSRVRAARVAAEPISAGSLSQFCDRFESHGFRPHSLCPSYGMAEATLALTCSSPREELVSYKRDSGGVLERSRQWWSDPRSTVGSGPVLDGTQVDAPSGGHLGRIRVRGPQVAQTYLGGSPLLRDGWHETGDEGGWLDGGLVVLGRMDDVLLVRGESLRPEEVETVICEGSPEIRGGRVAVIQDLANDQLHQGGLAVLAEVRDGTRDLTKVCRSVGRTLAGELGRPTAVALYEAGSLPVTTSGKLSRARCRDMASRGFGGALEVWTK